MEAEIRGMDKLMAELDRLSGAQFEAAAGKGIRSVAARCARTAKLLAPEDSGELRNSIHYTSEKDGAGVTAYCYTNSDHAAFMEFGTGPVGAASGGNGSGVKVTYNMGPWLIKRGNFKKGVVVEKYADYWVYKGSDGKFRATRGNKPKPFMYPAFRQTEKDAARRMARAMRNFVKKQGDGGDA